eukprot:4067555-Pleurochrysis_carterae.AAC.1
MFMKRIILNIVSSTKQPGPPAKTKVIAGFVHRVREKDTFSFRVRPGGLQLVWGAATNFGH